MATRRQLKLTDWQRRYLEILSDGTAHMTGNPDYGAFRIFGAPGEGTYYVLPQHGRSLIRRGLVERIPMPYGYGARFGISVLGLEALRTTDPAPGEGSE